MRKKEGRMDLGSKREEQKGRKDGRGERKEGKERRE